MHRAMERADVIICTSPDYLETSTSSSPIGHGAASSLTGSTSRSSLMHIALDRGLPVACSLSGAASIAVGRLIYYKGFEHIIRAMAALMPGYSSSVTASARALEAVARDCGVSGRVHFLGEIIMTRSSLLLGKRRLSSFPHCRSEASGSYSWRRWPAAFP